MKPKEVLEKCLGLVDDPTQKKGRTKRLTDLLKAPEADDTPDWFMCLPSCFNDALDLRQTTLEGNTQWTQGSAFSFKTGDTLYDTPQAYHQWKEALRHIKIGVQVHSATDAVPEKRSKEKGLLAPRYAGSVRISISLPTPNGSALAPIGQFELTQDDFVRFLIAGPTEQLREHIEAKRK